MSELFAGLLDGVPSFPKALCAHYQPELWWPEKGSSATLARSICRRCPERMPCLRYAIEEGLLGGIWGGLSNIERRQIRMLKTPRQREKAIRAALSPRPSTRPSGTHGPGAKPHRCNRPECQAANRAYKRAQTRKQRARARQRPGQLLLFEGVGAA